jgi:hypothetical protein
MTKTTGTWGGPQSRKQRMRIVWDGTRWTKEHEQAFRTLKGALITAPVLAMPNGEGKFVLACDASDVAWGAVLSQLDSEGMERPIAYYSKKLLPSEQKWDSWEREASAASGQPTSADRISWGASSISSRTPKWCWHCLGRMSGRQRERTG